MAIYTKELNTISVIIPTYNRLEFLERALKSVLSQTIEVQEIIVVDDASTDTTGEMMRSYSKEHANIHYIKLEVNGGAQIARNTGLKHSNSDWIAFLDSDNAYHPDMLEKLKAQALKNPDTDIVTCYSSQFIEKEDKQSVFGWKTLGNIYSKILSEEMYVDFNSAIIRRSKLIDIGMLDENCRSYQEWDTFIRLAKEGSFDYVPEELTLYYEHQEGRISDSTQLSFEGRMYLLNKFQEEIRLNCNKQDYKKLLDTAFSLSGEIENKIKRLTSRVQMMLFDPMYVVQRFFSSMSRRLT